MSRLLESVVDLTGNRDRDALELTVVGVLADILGRWICASSSWCRWVTTCTTTCAPARALRGCGGGGAVGEPECLPPLGDHPEAQTCTAQQRPLCRIDPDQGCTRYLFPVSNGREAIGWLELLAREPLTEEHERLVGGMLRIYSNHLAILDYSEHDALTGLMNRKTFDDTFFKLLATTHRHTRSGDGTDGEAPPQGDLAHWLAVVDIDHFKRINDRFGHLYGDEVLLLLSRLMRTAFRLGDRLFRFGGEEFVMVLDRTQAEDAARVFERFRARVEDFDFPQIGRVTVSLGYTRIRPGDLPTAAFDRADEAMYHAKQNGRNRICDHAELIALGAARSTVVAPEIELF